MTIYESVNLVSNSTYPRESFCRISTNPYLYANEFRKQTRPMHAQLHTTTPLYLNLTITCHHQVISLLLFILHCHYALVELYTACNITTQLTPKWRVSKLHRWFLWKTHVVSLTVTNDIARTMQPIRGLRPAEYEVFKSGGLWDPKTGLPVPELQKMVSWLVSWRLSGTKNICSKTMKTMSYHLPGCACPWRWWVDARTRA